jgi:hypothetical protein
MIVLIAQRDINVPMKDQLSQSNVLRDTILIKKLLPVANVLQGSIVIR